MQKKNIPFLITYIMTILLFFLAAMFYRQSFFAVLLLLLCVLPIISILFTSLTVRKLKIILNLDATSVTAGHPIKIRMSIENPTILPLLNGAVYFTFQNLYYPNPEVHEMSLPLEPLRKEPYLLPFDTCYAGMVSFDFSDFIVTDFLHLRSFKIIVNKHFEIPVLPDAPRISFDIPAPAMRETDEDVIFVAQGEQTGDIREFREYRPGDRLKDIHWKLTAKSDSLMVKEYEKAAGHTLLLLPDLFVQPLQDTLCTFYSTCKFLVRSREIFEVCIYYPADRSFTYHQITEEEQILPVLYKLYYAGICGVPNAALSLLSEQLTDTSGIMQILGKEILVNGYAIPTREESTKE